MAENEDWSRNLIPLEEFKEYEKIKESKDFPVLEKMLSEGGYLIIDTKGAFFDFKKPGQVSNFEKYNIYIGRKGKEDSTPRFIICVNRIGML